MPFNVPDCELSDLICKVASGDSEAFAALYKLTSRTLYGIVMKIVRRRDLAEDALQGIYIKIWHTSPKFKRDLGSPVSWMAVIARNHALDKARSLTRLPNEGVPYNCERPVEFDSLEKRRRDRLNALLPCLLRLDAQKRQLILLAYYHGASRKELSHRFGIPIATIKTQLRRPLAQLKEDLERHIVD